MLKNFVHVFVFDVETVLENAKLVILERLELQILCALTQPVFDLTGHDLTGCDL